MTFDYFYGTRADQYSFIREKTVNYRQRVFVSDNPGKNVIRSASGPYGNVDKE